ERFGLELTGTQPRVPSFIRSHAHCSGFQISSAYSYSYRGQSMIDQFRLTRVRTNRRSSMIAMRLYDPTGATGLIYAFRLSGTLPPLSASFVMTCFCNHTFIVAEPSRAPV